MISSKQASKWECLTITSSVPRRRSVSMYVVRRWWSLNNNTTWRLRLASPRTTTRNSASSPSWTPLSLDDPVISITWTSLSHIHIPLVTWTDGRLGYYGFTSQTQRLKKEQIRYYSIIEWWRSIISNSRVTEWLVVPPRGCVVLCLKNTAV